MIDVPDSELRQRLTAALGVTRFVDEVAARAPFPDLDALITTAVDAATALTDAELDEAVAHHPRIGEQPTGDGTSAALSRGEQGGLDAAAEGVDAAIVRGNRVYEERFGRVFLIRAAGRTGQDMADELQRRLTNCPEEEAEEAKEQLRQIMTLRLRALFAEEAA
ncbi:MAG: hypothetical protein JWP66_1262 [Naasia sp.]|nr:hypothetical protein [Naasia sp.]